MNRRAVLKVLGVAPLAAMPGAASAREEVRKLSGDDIDVKVLQAIIESNQLPWEAMRKAWDEKKAFYGKHFPG